MVSPACFPLTEDRKHLDRLAVYYSPPYQERRESAYSYAESTGGGMNDRDGGIDPQQRKRIAVACGRCRKRKIRCSGDKGNGEPCTNCRNAGHDPCQFLRVSSHETPIRPGRGEGFSYGIDASRHFQARGSSSMMPSVNQSLATPTYLENGSNYAYGSRQYYPLQGFSNGYAENAGGVEYPLYPAAYSSAQDPNYMVNYRLGSNGPAREPGAPIYVDAEAAPYGYGTAPSSGPPIAPRQPSNAEMGSFSFQNVAAGLSNSLNGNDRALPAPSRRPLPSSAPRPYRADSVSSVYSKHSPSTVGTSPPSPVQENGNYAAYGGSLSLQLSRGNDMYTTSSSDSMIHSSDSVRMSGSGPEMTYRYHDTTTRRSSASLPHGLSIGSGLPYIQPQSHGEGGNSFMMAGTGDMGTNAEAHGPADCDRKPLAGVRS